jgi:hypothetical protein
MAWYQNKKERPFQHVPGNNILFVIAERVQVKAIPVIRTHKLASKHMPSSLIAAAALEISSTDLAYTHTKKKKKC